MKASNARGQRISGTKLEQTLETRQIQLATAERMKNVERIKMLKSEIETLRAEIIKRREAAKARAEKRSADSKDAWYRQQMAKALLNK
jgi:capsule polysaccharide export protein KpsE/RkpR